MKESNTFPFDEEKIFSIIISFVEKDQILFFHFAKNKLFPLFTRNAFLLNPREFNVFIEEEVESFLNFLKTKDLNISADRGKKAAIKGIGEKFITVLSSTLKSFFFINLPIKNYEILDFTYRIIDKYMDDYILNYINIREIQINKEQQQLYDSLITTISKQREEILQKEKEQNRQKTVFLINLAHELKLPLTFIRVYGDMTAEEISPKKSENLSHLIDSARGAQELVSNILDYEKILQGKMLYNHNTIVNISKAAISKLKLIKAITDKNNISLESEIQPDLYIQIASQALDRILNNLLDNAIKFNREKGSIRVEVKASDTSVFLIIQDTGIGIPASEIQHIFKPYYQCTHKRKSNQGIGAGLSLVKVIMDEVCGNIAVDSVEDKGTTFTITFKRKLITEANRDKVLEDIKISNPINRVNIVIKQETYNEKIKSLFFIEDNLELLATLQKSINSEFNFFYAINGKEALSQIELIPKPDVIISDIMMDEMDGYEFLLRLREQHDFRDIPFIFLTAKTTEADKIKGLRYGAVDYIEKPFSIEILKEKIKSLIREHEINNRITTEKIEKRMIRTIREKEKPPIDFGLLYGKFGLSPMERKVLKYLIDGLDAKETAEKLFIGSDTVRQHIRKIREKCKVENNIQLINLFKSV